MTSIPLRALLVEDSPDDSALVLGELKRGGFAVESRRVDTATAFLSALEEQPWDVILADYSMPHYNGLAAFDTLMQSSLDIPFIFVSGQIGEDLAVEAMLHGAKDYVRKDNLSRLVPAVERELKDAEDRRKRQAMADALRESDEKLRARERLLQTVFDTLPVHLVVKDTETRYLMVNRAWCERYGLTPAQVTDKTSLEMPGRPEEDKRNTLAQDRETLASDGKTLVFEGWDTTASGELRHYQSSKAPLRDDTGKVIGLVGATVDLTDLKRSEEALRASEDRYRSLVETSIQGICVVTGMKIVFLNPAMARMFGYESPQEVLKSGDLFQHIVEEDKTRVVELSRARLSGGPAPTRFEFQAIRKDGQQIWCESSSAVILWEGKPSVLATIVDITERKRAEAALRASERLMRTIIDTLPVELVVKDAETRYLIVNREWCERYGLTPEQAIGKTTMEMPGRPEAEKRLTLQHDRQTLAADDKVVVIEGSDTAATGKVRHYQSIRAPLRDENKKVIGLVGATIDTTQPKRIEDELRASKQLLQTVFDTIPNMLIVTDSESRILMVNKAWSDTLGIAPKDAVNRLALDLPNIPEAVKRGFAEEERQIFTQGRTIAGTERLLPVKGGRQKPFVVYKSPIHDDTGTVIGLVGAFVDISDRVRAEEELLGKERLLQAVFQTLPVPLVLKDAETRHLMVNPAWCERYGVTAEQVIGKTSLKIPGRPEADKQATYEHDQEALTTVGKTVINDGWDTTATGRKRHFQRIRAAFQNESGKVVGLVVATIDQTEQRLAEAKLRANERLLQTVFNTIPVHLVVKDTDARYQMVNRAWCERYGLTPEQAVGKTAVEVPVRPEADRQRTLEEDRKTLAGDSPLVQFEGWDTTARGEIRHYQSLKAPLRDDSGKVIGMVGATVDFTEQKRAEAKLRANEKLLQTVFDAIPMALVVKDRESRYQMVNKAWCERYGMNPEQAIGKVSFDVPGQPDSATYLTMDQDRRALSGHYEPFTFEAWRSVHDQELRVYQTRKVPYSDENGQVAGLVSLSLDITDAKRAEEKLRANERLLQTVFETIPVHVVVKDVDTRYQMVNKAWCERYGLTPEQVIGKKSMEIPGRPEAEKRITFEHDQETLATTEKFVQFEGWDTTASGEIRHFQRIRSPLRDDNGKTIGLIGVTVDLTELKRSEQKLRANERLLKTVFDTIPHLLTVKDRQSRYMMVNKAWSDLTGISQQDALQIDSLAVPDRPRAEALEIMAEDRMVLSGGGPSIVADRLLTIKNGERRYFHSIKSPLREEKGGVVGVVTIMVDLTAEKAAQAKADIAHARLFDAIESLPAAFYLYGPDERLAVWNSRVGEFFPAAYPQLKTAMTFEDVLRLSAETVEDSKGQVNAWIQGRLRQFRSNPGPFEQRLADGRWLQGLDRRTSDGGTVCLRFDITNIKKQEEHLRQAQKMEAVGQLTGGIAHDFNNILAVIMSFGEMVLDRVDKGSSLHSDMQVILDAGNRAAALTRQLLAYSRRQVLRMESVNMNETVTGMEKMLRRLVPENVELRTYLDPDLELVNADQSQLEQIIMNLTVNARDAMPTGGVLTIETKNRVLAQEDVRDHGAAKDGPHVMLVMTDTGIGMDDATQARVFEPFFTTKEVGKGTGMGLATVHGIVNQMGGTIWLYSEPGKGTSFKILLPSLPGPEIVATGSKAGKSTNAAGSGTILLVEDEDAVREAAHRILSSAGYTVHMAKNGKEAVEILNRMRGEISCILSDVVMPGMSAKEMFEAIRKISKVPVVFMSGYTDVSIISQGILEGNVPFIHKPFTKRSVIEKIREALST